jgi:AcrR family transcriptional regulator
MPKQKKLSARKEPVQERSIELRNSILKAATYVLKKEGPFGFTTNKVADRAGVNIASLYQYYPNKEALLFHLVEIEWSTTFNAVFPILEDGKKSCRERLQLFVEKFYETEAEEFDLRQALGVAAVTISETKEYQQLSKKVDEAFLKFFSEALIYTTHEDLKYKVGFVRHLISSFSELQPAKPMSEVRRDASTMSEMLCEYFKIT